MQAELRVQRPDLAIELHGINAPGHESGNAQACTGRSLPWLQDTYADDVAGDWAITFRDCVLLDTANKTAHTYNLTTHNLSVPEDYQELKALLIALAGG